MFTRDFDRPGPRRAPRGSGAFSRHRRTIGQRATAHGAGTAPSSRRASYDAQDITVLEGLEAVRKRPGMYIGSTGVRGLHHLVYEVVDNSVDEALAGYCDAVDGDDPPRQLGHGRRRRPRHPGRDHGEGGPAGRRGRAHRPARRRQVRRRRRLQGLRRPARRRRVGRQRAVGAARTSRSAATATSGRRTTSRGAPQGDAREGRADRRRPGTTITFLPDADIFETLDFDFSTLEERLRETAFLTRGLKISIVDERGEGHAVEFQYEGGIEDFVAYLNENKEPIHSKVVFFAGESDEGAVEVAMQWNSSYQESIFSFANNINTHEGGSHMSRLPLGADAHAQQVRARARACSRRRTTTSPARTCARA